MNFARIAVFLVVVIVMSWMIAWVADRAHPEAPAPNSLYPSVGQIIFSKSEGFTQQIIKTDRNDAWVELRIAPHAPGPPAHVHRTFAERFFVVKGTLSLRVGDQIIEQHAGEQFKVPPGVVHQPFNPTNEEVIVRGPLTPEYALPRDFVLFLSQIYGWIDESPAHARPPAVLLQMSIFSPKYDAWLATPSVGIQRIQSALLHPVARMLGYRSYYPRFCSSNRPQLTKAGASR